MKVFISTGEISGDLHGAALAKELQLLSPEIEISGLGSSKMRAAGVEIVADVSVRSTIGFVEPIRHLFFFLNLWRKLKKLFKENPPDILVLIDFQGFNLPLANFAKKQGIRTVYFIPPQEWIWGSKRGTSDVVKYSDLIISVFKPCAEFYQKNGGKVVFVGHPLLDLVKPTASLNPLDLASAPLNPPKVGGDNADSSELLVGLFPGSRHQEIESLLPVMLKLAKHNPTCNFAISVASSVLKTLIEQHLSSPHFGGIKGGRCIRLVENAPYELMNSADLIISSSGTTTLEAAILQKPMVVIYKLSAATWFIAKNIFKMNPKFIALPNILADAKVVPEFILNWPKAEAEMLATTQTLIDSKAERVKMAENLAAVKESLGEPGAIKRAAAEILKIS